MSLVASDNNFPIEAMFFNHSELTILIIRWAHLQTFIVACNIYENKINLSTIIND